MLPAQFSCGKSTPACDRCYYSSSKCNSVSICFCSFRVFLFDFRPYQLAQVDRIDFGFDVCYYWDIVEMVRVLRAMCFRCSIPMMSLAFDEVEKCFLLAICWYVWIAISGFKFFPRLVAMMLLDVMFLPVATTPLDRGLVLMLAYMIAVAFIKSLMVFLWQSFFLI